MCTAAVYRSDGVYFGRNMDIDRHFHEEVVTIPDHTVFKLKNCSNLVTIYAIAGMASIIRKTPLFADAFNEKGLAGAGLNFPGSACYRKAENGAENLAPYEIMWRILGTCANLKEARDILEHVNITDIPFDTDVPIAPMHFIFADETGCIVVEQTEDGMHIYDDPYDVLTNNPPFPYHMYNMVNYRGCSARDGESDYPYELKPYAAGMGAIGLPGDNSSASRFIRAAYNLSHAVPRKDDAAVMQVFHILDSVKMTEGTVLTGNHTYDRTIYQTCMDLKNKIYYYRTYENSTIHGIPLQKEVMLNVYPLQPDDMIIE